LKATSYFPHFMLLGLFWGLSPSLYRHLSDIHLPPLQTIFYSGLGVGLVMLGFAVLRGGWRGLDRRLVFYGLACACLMNIPFGLNLFLAAYVPPTELAIIITLSPFFAYLLALVLRHDHATPRKLLAIALGFLSTLILILSREGGLSGHLSLPLLAALLIPMLYSCYNTFAAWAWPKGADTIQAGAMESLWSGITILPFLYFLAPIGAAGDPTLTQHWILIAVCAMWVVERLVYFTLITNKGAVYTVQATYVSTPASVIIGALFFGGGTDVWLWASLAILMLALYLNNTSGKVEASPATNPESHPV
jgi:drug/metabolite transporter (DMT)-like permease